MPDNRQPIVSVSGEAESRHPAERATVRIGIGFEGPRRADVVPPTEALYAELVRALQGMHDADAGPVTRWSGDQISVWGQRPWNAEGKQRPVVYRTRAAFRVRFSDFERLGQWVTETALRDGVAVDGIEWSLTDETRQAATAEVGRRAVAAAIAKATIYAEALGFHRVRALAVSDPGLLDSGGAAPQPTGYAMAMPRGGAGSAAGIELAPDEITIAASVHARFAAQ